MQQDTPDDELNVVPVLCRLTSTDKFSAIKEVIDFCTVFDTIGPRDSFTDAVFKREFLESTGIGHGVALSHGKMSSIKKITIGLGISREGLPFDSVDGKPVHILFVIGSSPEKQEEYLSSLSALMRYMRNTAFRSYLKNLFTPGYSTAGLYRSFFSMLSSQEFIRNKREGVIITGTGLSKVPVGIDCTI